MIVMIIIMMIRPWNYGYLPDWGAYI